MATDTKGDTRWPHILIFKLNANGSAKDYWDCSQNFMRVWCHVNGKTTSNQLQTDRAFVFMRIKPHGNFLHHCFSAWRSHWLNHADTHTRLLCFVIDQNNKPSHQGWEKLQFRNHLFEWKVLYFYCNFTEVCSHGSNKNMPPLVHGWVPNRQQAIIRANDGLVYRCIYASLYLNVLNKVDRLVKWNTLLCFVMSSSMQQKTLWSFFPSN